MKWSLLLVAWLAVGSLAAQPHERLVSTAGATVANNGLVQISIGEPVIGTAGSGSLTLTQGFLQVFKTPVNTRDPRTAGPSFLLFPNPSDGRVTLVHDLPDDQQLDIHVYDLLGEKVHVDRARGICTLDLFHLTPGIYFMQIRQGNDIHSIKFEKF